MCGIAGLIHRGKTSNIGAEMTAMLRALKHRGPDSTGFAVYGAPDEAEYVMRFKVAEQEELRKGIAIHQQVKDRRKAVDERLAAVGARIDSAEEATEYAFRYRFAYDGSLTTLAEQLEDIDSVEILSIGRGLELVKDLGDADVVAGQYGLTSFTGTHAIGHTRMATESDVDIRSAHPYWAYPYSDIAVVHNGQITNYWNKRRDLERRGHRFVSNCDSELLAVYTADMLERGHALEESLSRSVEEIDGVFTYFVATKDELGMAKDTMAAKPLVLFESDDVVAVASEEIAIRTIFPQEIDTFDPYDGEVKVWKA